MASKIPKALPKNLYKPLPLEQRKQIYLLVHKAQPRCTIQSICGFSDILIRNCLRWLISIHNIGPISCLPLYGLRFYRLDMPLSGSLSRSTSSIWKIIWNEYTMSMSSKYEVTLNNRRLRASFREEGKVLVLCDDWWQRKKWQSKWLNRLCGPTSQKTFHRKFTTMDTKREASYERNF